MSARKQRRGYEEHEGGRWFESLVELAVHNFLFAAGTPYYSGIDPKVYLGDGTARSDDLVIPKRLELPLPEVRIEVAGRWNDRRWGIEDMEKYRRDKRAVHDFWTERGVIHVLLKPPSGTNMPDHYLGEMLGRYLGGTEADFQAMANPRRPGSTYDTGEEMIGKLRQLFPSGSLLTTPIISEHPELGDSFLVYLYKFFKGNTIHRVAGLSGMKAKNGHYGETKEQFLLRLEIFLNEEYGLPMSGLPTSHKLNVDRNSWVNERAGHHFGSYRDLRTHLGLPQNINQPFTEDVVRDELIRCTPPGRSRPAMHTFSQENGSMYVWIQKNRKRLGFSSPVVYVEHMLSK